MKSCSELNKVTLSRKCIFRWDKHFNQRIAEAQNKIDWIEFHFKAFRQLWLRPYGWWWDELVKWRKWEETGVPRENRRTRCLFNTKSLGMSRDRSDDSYHHWWTLYQLEIN